MLLVLRDDHVDFTVHTCMSKRDWGEPLQKQALNMERAGLGMELSMGLARGGRICPQVSYPIPAESLRLHRGWVLVSPCIVLEWRSGRGRKQTSLVLRLRFLENDQFLGSCTSQLGWRLFHASQMVPEI